jgi:nucleotide-binding universal stress UspA family protein
MDMKSQTELTPEPFHILLAVDGSGHSYAAAALVSELPLPDHSVVTVLGVVTPYYTPERAQLEMAVKETLSNLARQGIEATSGILYGYPPAELTKYAERLKPNLIVIGAKGLRATLGVLLGGVAQQVVEYARCPVLVVRAPYAKIQNILLLTDGSQYSDRAVEYMTHFPLPSGVRVHVMHVLTPFVPTMAPATLPLGPTMVPTIPSEQELAAHEQAGQAIVDRACQTLQDAHLPTIAVLEHGDPVEKIIEYAKAHEIQLIVCGSRGLGSLAGWLLGSVSRKLVHYFDCSVLVVKGDDASRD